MKTIGYCEGCKWWGQPWEDHGKIAASCPRLTRNDLWDGGCRVYDDSDPITTEKDFGCIYWEAKESGTWPLKSEQDLKIEDLQRENDAAFERIQKLSKALVDLGYDPTQLP